MLIKKGQHMIVATDVNVFSALTQTISESKWDKSFD